MTTTVAAWPPPKLDAAPLLKVIGERLDGGAITRNRLLGPSRHLYERALHEGNVTLHGARNLCERLDLDPAEVWPDDYAAAASIRPHRYNDPQRYVHLDAAPLLAAIERTARDRGISAYALLDDTAARRRYEDARTRGTVTLVVAEGLCDRLGWHPRELWGDAWDAAALAGRPADYDPWEGVA
jgi:hypothetical protein